MQEVIITNEKGETFLVAYENDNYTISKIENGEKKEPTKEEMAFALKELEKVKQATKKNTYDDYLKMLKDMLEAKTIKGTAELENFIQSTTLSPEEKEKLLREGIQGLDLQDIINLRNRIIGDLRGSKKEDMEALIGFNVKDNAFGSSYCEIKMGFKDSIGYNERLNATLDYNDNLKKELIEPVIAEVMGRSKIKTKSLSKTGDSFNNRGNLGIATEEKVKVALANVEYDYADKLDKNCENLKNRAPELDPEARDKNAQEFSLDNESPSIPADEELLTDENGNMYSLNGEYVGRINEYGEIVRDEGQNLSHEESMKLVRKPLSNIKKKESGFVAIAVIAITSFITSLIVIIQMLLLG